MKKKRDFKSQFKFHWSILLLLAVVLTISGMSNTVMAANNDIMVDIGGVATPNAAGVKINAAGSVTGVNNITTTGNANVGNNLNVTGQTSLQDRLSMNGNNINMSNPGNTAPGGSINMYGGSINMGTDPVTSTVGNVNMNGGNVNMGGGNINNVNNLTVNGDTSLRSTSGLQGLDINDTNAQIGYLNGGTVNGLRATSSGLAATSTDSATYSSTLSLDGTKAYMSYYNGTTENGLAATAGGVGVGSTNYVTGTSSGLTTDGTDLIVGYTDPALVTTTGTGVAYGLHTDNDEVNVGYLEYGATPADNVFHGLTVTNSMTTLSGGTSSTTQQLDDNGVRFIDDPTAITTFSVSNTGDAMIAGDLDMTGGSITNVNNINATTFTGHLVGMADTVGANGVDTAAIQDLAVTTGKIADDAITQAKMADNSVGTNELIDLNVTTAKIADDAITQAKMADNAVGTNELIDLNVTTAKIADGAVTSAKLDTNIAIVGTLDVGGLTSTNGGLANTGALTSTGGNVSLNTAAGADNPGNAQLALTNNTGASLLYTNSSGNTHGLTVGETSTVLSGGTTSTSLTLNNWGATFNTNGNPARVTGVADGENDYDAVNYRQMQKAYIGIASVSALAAIPSTMPGKKFAIGAGYGYFENESAVAIGLKASLFDRLSITAGVGLGVGSGPSSTASANAGFSYSF